VKRTLWSILTAAAAAVLPGMHTGHTTVDLSAPIPEASAKPAAEAVESRKCEIRHDERQLDDFDADPAPVIEAPLFVESVLAFAPAPATILAPSSTPDLIPLARRSLGRPRVRAPDRTV
jgi:hypothetical protein